MGSANLRDDGFNSELRVYVVQYLVLALFIALGIRFYVLQVARHEDYQARAENNRIREIPIPAPRGAIGRCRRGHPARCARRLPGSIDAPRQRGRGRSGRSVSHGEWQMTSG